ncbi:NIPSNAP family protein [Rhizorhabdus argentea]|uniref:NIPSNAP family protein n=1 Tax=Rhizorhabdus argentea TaxID=1387174 RepID=UPI0030EF2CCD
MFTHVTVELKYGQAERFAAAMAKVVKLATEQCGWELRDALFQIDGRMYTVRHIWKLRDLNHYAEGIAVLMAHPDFPALEATLGETIERETISFAVPAPYAPAA